ncbi:MAG TPA: 4Fe-4S binding protein, partial [Desulfuromonadales bacterium]|nr:4Fe-4S binding protein [Desulfuromonadales bacterium]
MDSQTTWAKVRPWRRTLQAAFALLTLSVGIRFGLFVREVAAGAPVSWQRPPSVEGFLPIGALVSLKHWLLTGAFDRIHPAALVLLLTFIGISLVAKKSFCSWLCPVGTLSDALAAAGRRVFGRNVLLPRWLDIPLRSLKYLGIAFFLKLIAIDMPATALGGFLNSPYWASADVRMLYFFTRPSTVTLIVLAVLVVFSL